MTELVSLTNKREKDRDRSHRVVATCCQVQGSSFESCSLTSQLFNHTSHLRGSSAYWGGHVVTCNYQRLVLLPKNRSHPWQRSFLQLVCYCPSCSLAATMPVLACLRKQQHVFQVAPFFRQWSCSQQLKRSHNLRASNLAILPKNIALRVEVFHAPARCGWLLPLHRDSCLIHKCHKCCMALPQIHPQLIMASSLPKSETHHPPLTICKYCLSAQFSLGKKRGKAGGGSLLFRGQLNTHTHTESQKNIVEFRGWVGVGS